MIKSRQSQWKWCKISVSVDFRSDKVSKKLRMFFVKFIVNEETRTKASYFFLKCTLKKTKQKNKATIHSNYC